MKNLAIILGFALLLLSLWMATPSTANERKVIYYGNGIAASNGVEFISNYKPAPSVIYLEITFGVEDDATLTINWNGEPFAANSGNAVTANQGWTGVWGVNPRARYGFEVNADTTVYYTITEVHQQ